VEKRDLSDTTRGDRGKIERKKEKERKLDLF
jgi:hypothetical protein